MTDQLKPCPNPWCLAKDVSIMTVRMVNPKTQGLLERKRVECTEGCGLCGPKADTDEAAAEAWNTRDESAEGEDWRDHVEQRMRTWRQQIMNKSGDRLALDDFMGQESIDDLIDYVCDEWAFLRRDTKKESAKVERLRARVAELETAQAWKSVDSAPADCDLLLYCPDRGPTNEARIELRQFKNTRAGSMHAWATHWMSLPKEPEES